jgi:lipopolysaccharide export system protein LptA
MNKIALVSTPFPQACGISFHSTVLKAFCLIFLSFFFIKNTYAQYPTGGASPQNGDTTTVQILQPTGVGEFIMVNNEMVRKLKGNVRLKHKDAMLFCDSAILDNQNNVFARGNVIIQQGDSLNIFADSMRYFGFTRQADLFSDVRLDNKGKQLFTEKLHYDLNTKIATYNTKSTLADARTQVTSRRGQYNVNENMAYFKDKVLVVDKDLDIKTDTLRFDTKNNIAFFFGPTLMYTKDSAQFYTEGGYYDLQKESGEFLKTPQYRKGSQVAVGDTMYYDGKTALVTLKGNASTQDSLQKAQANTIRYNRKTEESWLEGNAFFKDDKQNVTSDTIFFNGKTKTYTTRGRSDIVNGNQRLQADFVDFNSADSMGIAKGNVFWQDTSAKSTIRCDSMAYNQRTDYIKASGGRPILTSLVDNDTLWMRADTIISFKPNPKDSAKALLAYHNVKMFKSNFQSVCDSLSYSEVDSIFRLFRNPIIWSDTSQMTSDTIRILLKNKKIDRIFLRQNGLIVNSKDEIFYNQIKGKDITAFFENDEIRRMLAAGNAESLYYATDEGNAYINANKVICSEMLIYFGNNKVEKIKFYTQPQAKAHPMGTTNHSELKLKGFRWDIKKKPKSVKDL